MRMRVGLVINEEENLDGPPVHHHGTNGAIEPKSFSAQLDLVGYYPAKFEPDRHTQNRR